MELELEKSWKKILETEMNLPYYFKLLEYVNLEYSNGVCYPLKEYIFEAFNQCPFDEVKVVIIGQDPYINPNQAHGLCFSVPMGESFPPSLKNVYKELKADLNIDIPFQGDLTRWANQGVLLLNSTLTVKEGESNSHAGKGWGQFTDAVIEAINQHKKEVVYMLWGSFAQKKANAVNPNQNRLLKSPHPSPLSAYRGFFGSKHFSRANDYLTSRGKTPIQW